MALIDANHFIPKRYRPDIETEPIVYNDETLYERLIEVQKLVNLEYQRLAETIADMQFAGSDPKITAKIRIIMKPEAVQQLQGDGSSNIDRLAKQFDTLGRKLDSISMIIACLRNRIEKNREHFFLI